MGVLVIRYIMHLLMIQLLGCLAGLCNIALAQLDLGETVTGSVSSPDIAIACFVNLAVFVTSLLRGRLDLEMGARDVLATMRIPGLDKLNVINDGLGMTTCAEGQPLGEASVVMLSYGTPISSMTQFMKYFSEAYKLHSILLQCFPLQSPQLLPETYNKSKCKCIVFYHVEDILILLASRMPGTIKRISDSLCLLSCPDCLETGCHGCNQGLLHVKRDDESGRKILTEGEPAKERKVVNEIFDYISGGDMKQQHSCICIPLSPQGYDQWTHMLMTSLGATRRRFSAIDPSFFAPRLTEVVLNLVLTGWFRVDGFSSAFVARWAIRDYVVQRGGFAASAFLAGTLRGYRNDCCVLRFRGMVSGIRTFSFIIGFVNIICSVTWVVLSAFHGGIGKWYDTHSMPLSKLRVDIVMVAIGISLGMDSLHLYLRRYQSAQKIRHRVMVWSVIVLELMLILLGSRITGILGIKVVGRGLYSALQVLIWIKWGIGSDLLGDLPPEYEHDPKYDFDNGILVYSSAFLLNFILAGVRCNWNYSLSLSN